MNCAKAFSIASLLLVNAEAIAQVTTRVSVGPGGVEGNADCQRECVSISADGRFVAFVSYASNLDVRDTNAVQDAFVHDRQTGRTELVSVNPDETAASTDGGSANAVISANGRWVAFGSAASTLVAGDVNHHADVFVFDRESRTMGIVSVDSMGNLGDGNSSEPSISADGRFVAFSSSAINLALGDGNDMYDVFVRDRDVDRNGDFDEPGSAATTRVSISSSGIEGNDNSWHPKISADGRVVVFCSRSSTLAEVDSSATYEVFAHELVTGETSLVTVGQSGAAAGGPSALAESASPISADGRYVAFSSGSTDQVPDDWNNTADVFVRDRQSGETIRVSVDSDGVPGNAQSIGAVISRDGRYVAFASGATNLVPGDSNGVVDLFVHDRVSRVTTRANVSPLVTEADSGVFGAAFSADARLLVFASTATNLVFGDTNARTDVFVRDWLPLVIESIFPATGSESGGDLVHVLGRDFSSTIDVRFGTSPATIASISPSQIDVCTPPGIGVVDVTASIPTTGATSTAAFAYVAPELAARYGTVNVARGDRENVLLVNGVSGDPITREIVVRTRNMVSVVMLSPSSRASASFAIYAWPGAPSAATIRPQPRNLGVIGFPTPHDTGLPQPTAIGNNLDPRLGVATFATSPATSLVGRLPRGVRRATTVTLQGFIVDSASPSSAQVSVTNAIVLRVVP